MRRADWLVDLGPGAGPARRADRRPGHARRRSPPIPTRSPAAIWPAASGSPCRTRRRRIAASPLDHDRRRDDEQSQERDGAVPALGAGLRDGRERLGQELAVERDAGPGPGAPAGRPGPQARPAHQPPRGEPDRQGGADRPVADRPHAAEQSGHVHGRVRRDPQGVCQHPRRPGPRLPGRPLQLQHQGRPLRGVPGPGPAADRNELPPRPVRPLPGLRRQALQPADAGDPLPRPVDRRRARHAGGRGGRVLREFPGHRPAAWAACRKWAWAT